MAHLIFEYTDNLADQGDIPGLLQKANQVLIESGMFPVGGIRSRAIRLTEYCIADGGHDDAFVHLTVKAGAGRDPAEIAAVMDQVFEMMKAHFADIYEKQYLALSLELYEFNKFGTLKHNNIHSRYGKK